MMRPIPLKLTAFKIQLLFLIIGIAFSGSCKKNKTEPVNTTSYMNAVIDGNSFTSNNVFITKDPTTNDLIEFYFLTGDSLSIGIQLSHTLPSYQPGAYTFRPAGTASVILVNFDVADSTSGRQINWATDQESNLDYFAIERSGDGINFVQIGRVNAVGNTTALADYTFTDSNHLSIRAYYYRLRMVNIDGSLSFSSIRSYRGLLNYIAFYGERSLKYKGFNGTVQITEHDRTAHVVNGNFFFDVTDSSGHTTHIRNGNFKVLY